jgi:hypothetical protein
MIMKTYLAILLLPMLISCSTDNIKDEKAPVKQPEKENVQEKDPEPIIGERVDGPAIVRDKPNGEALFELYDNTLVESAPLKDDWFQVLVYTDIDYEEFGIDSLVEGRYLISDGDTIGRILKTHGVSTGRGKDQAYAMVYGYTHKDNIKPGTIIENILSKKLAANERELGLWKGFIKSFKLEDDAIEYKDYKSYFNYENTVDDPSPGFRIVLLFQAKRLIGLIHSRELAIDNITTRTTNPRYNISFFKDIPVKDQQDFVAYMNEWVKGVD